MPPETTPAPGLTTAGWIFMIISVTFVTSLLIWCYRKVLVTGDKPAKPVEDFHSA